MFVKRMEKSMAVLAQCLFTPASISQALESDSNLTALNKEPSSVSVFGLVHKSY